MIEISKQMREFVNFAQDAVANNAKNTVARLGKQESRYSAFSINAATDGDSVGKLRRSTASKNANNTVRTKFRDVVAEMFGGADKIPPSVLAAMNLKDYAKGKPLTADRILDVYAAIKDHIDGLKNAALQDGTLRAIDVADTAADKFVEKFKANCKTPPSAVVVSNLKRALLLCAANILGDANKVINGNEAVKKFAKDLNTSFNYTFKALGIDTSTHKISSQRIKDLMKDEVHMRHAVFALLDKNGNVDVNNFDTRLAAYDDEELKRSMAGILRANLESPGPAAVKALQQEFVRMAVQKIGNTSRSEIEAFFKANPDKIPAALRGDKRASTAYVDCVIAFAGREKAALADRLAYGGDANARIDSDAALRDFHTFMDSLYATAEGDKDLISLIERFAVKIAFNSDGAQRQIAEIKARFIEPIRANLQELRSAAGGNQAVVKAGLGALVWTEMTPFKKDVLAKLVNGARALDLSGLDSLSSRSTPVEIAKAFKDLYAQFKKSVVPEDFHDRWSRPERTAFMHFFAGVVMSRLGDDDKTRLAMMFGTKAAETAGNIMQTLTTGATDLTPAENADLYDLSQIMRQCSAFIADDLSLDLDAFAVNAIDDKMTDESISAEVRAQFTALVKGMQE